MRRPLISCIGGAFAASEIAPGQTRVARFLATVRAAANRLPPCGQYPSVDRSAADRDAISASLATPAGFGLVFDRHFDAVHSYLQRRVGRDLADELPLRPSLSPSTGALASTSRAPDARPWLFGIATNLLRRHHRHELRQFRAYARSAVDPVLDPFDGVEDRLDATNMRRELVDALAQVPVRGARRPPALRLGRALLLRRSPARSTSRPAPSARGSPAPAGESAHAGRRISPRPLPTRPRGGRIADERDRLAPSSFARTSRPRAESRPRPGAPWSRGRDPQGRRHRPPSPRPWRRSRLAPRRRVVASRPCSSPCRP